MEHPSGQKLKDITGIAAILRYELDMNELRDIEENSEEEINSDDGEDIDVLNNSFLEDDDIPSDD